MSVFNRANLITQAISDNSTLPNDIFALKTAMGVNALARHYWRGDSRGPDLIDLANNGGDLRMPAGLNFRPAFGVISDHAMGRVVRYTRDKPTVLQSDKGIITAGTDIAKSFAAYWLGSVNEFNNVCQTTYPLQHLFGPGWELGVSGERTIGGCTLVDELHFAVTDNSTAVKARLQSVSTGRKVVSMLGVYNATADTVDLYTNLGTGVQASTAAVTTLVPLESYHLTVGNFPQTTTVGFGSFGPDGTGAQTMETKCAIMWEDSDVESWNQTTHDTLLTALGF